MNISTIIVHYFKHVALFNLIFETKRSTNLRKFQHTLTRSNGILIFFHYT